MSNPEVSSPLPGQKVSGPRVVPLWTLIAALALAVVAGFGGGALAAQSQTGPTGPVGATGAEGPIGPVGLQGPAGSDAKVDTLGVCFDYETKYGNVSYVSSVTLYTPERAKNGVVSCPTGYFIAVLPAAPDTGGN